jgi:Zn-dependent M28 family amino/carboxypeptidase
MPIRCWLIVLALLLPFTGATAAAPPLRDSTLRGHIKFLSDDLLEGRGIGTHGGEIATRYIATQLLGMGIRGAGPGGSYYQPVSLVGVKTDPQTELRVVGDRGQEVFRFADDFIAFTGAQTADVPVSAEMVFVGYGIEAKDERWNDYKGPPEDYRGKILVMLVNDPPATPSEPNLFGGPALTYYGRWTYKFEEAARRGAAGALLLHTDESAGYPWSVVRTSNASWRFDLERPQGDPTPYLAARAWITDPAAKRLFLLAGQDLAELRRRAATRGFQPVPLGLRAELRLKSEVKRITVPNVAGILDGSDPKKRGEYVVYSAHWDHLGVGEPDASGDRIYHGAVDNASGVAAVLAMAAQLAGLPPAARPRRSILFLFPTAEEQGLLGAEWYTEHPLVPLAQTVADINLDALNVLGTTRDIVALGAERSTLLRTVESVARVEKLRLSPDPRPEQGSYFRSDHFPFANKGVPAISLGNGTDFVGKPSGWGEKAFREFNEHHYHQPSDRYQENWDMSGMVQQVAFCLRLGEQLARETERPHLLPRRAAAEHKAGR